jgi:hypothetical protein
MQVEAPIAVRGDSLTVAFWRVDHGVADQAIGDPSFRGSAQTWAAHRGEFNTAVERAACPHERLFRGSKLLVTVGILPSAAKGAFPWHGPRSTKSTPFAIVPLKLRPHVHSEVLGSEMLNVCSLPMKAPKRT